MTYDFIGYGVQEDILIVNKKVVRKGTFWSDKEF